MSQPQTVTHETKIVLADGTALGVFGLAMVTLVAASNKMGWTTGTAYILPWAAVLGALAQIWGAAIDFKKNNYYGAIVLGAFGLFWVAVSFHWVIANGFLGAVPANADPKQFGFACLGYFIFSVFFTIATLEVNKVFFAILLLVNILLLSLGLSTLGIAAEFFHHAAAWSELVVSILSFYASGAIFLNSYYSRTLLPLGKPFGIIKKGTPQNSAAH